MVTAVPDVTRMTDRLVARQLVWKAREESDRRVVRLEISGQGLELLGTLDDPVLGWLDELLSPLSEREMRTLCSLADKARSS